MLINAEFQTNKLPLALRKREAHNFTLHTISHNHSRRPLKNNYPKSYMKERLLTTPIQKMSQANFQKNLITTLLMSNTPFGFFLETLMSVMCDLYTFESVHIYIYIYISFCLYQLIQL